MDFHVCIGHKLAGKLCSMFSFLRFIIFEPPLLWLSNNWVFDNVELNISKIPFFQNNILAQKHDLVGPAPRLFWEMALMRVLLSFIAYEAAVFFDKFSCNIWFLICFEYYGIIIIVTPYNLHVNLQCFRYCMYFWPTGVRLHVRPAGVHSTLT